MFRQKCWLPNGELKRLVMINFRMFAPTGGRREASVFVGHVFNTRGEQICVINGLFTGLECAQSGFLRVRLLQPASAQIWRLHWDNKHNMVIHSFILKVTSFALQTFNLNCRCWVQMPVWLAKKWQWGGKRASRDGKTSGCWWYRSRQEAAIHRQQEEEQPPPCAGRETPLLSPFPPSKMDICW